MERLAQRERETDRERGREMGWGRRRERAGNSSLLPHRPSTKAPHSPLYASASGHIANTPTVTHTEHQ